MSEVLGLGLAREPTVPSPGGASGRRRAWRRESASTSKSAPPVRALFSRSSPNGLLTFSEHPQAGSGQLVLNTAEKEQADRPQFFFSPQKLYIYKKKLTNISAHPHTSLHMQQHTYHLTNMFPSISSEQHNHNLTKILLKDHLFMDTRI